MDSGTGSITGYGLSPRLRGNRRLCLVVVSNPRSIPAPAGEPEVRSPLTSLNAVYPRACGGTTCKAGIKLPQSGLSPRLRGNRPRTRYPKSHRRSIPAPAGEPLDRSRPLGNGRVYPRACGGTCSKTKPWPLGIGLSPRLRGNHTEPVTPRASLRSIPAPAGEPTWTPGVSGLAKVYPRACGGTCWHRLF